MSSKAAAESCKKHYRRTRGTVELRRIQLIACSQTGRFLQHSQPWQAVSCVLRRRQRNVRLVRTVEALYPIEDTKSPIQVVVRTWLRLEARHYGALKPLQLVHFLLIPHEDSFSPVTHKGGQ